MDKEELLERVPEAVKQLISEDRASTPCPNGKKPIDWRIVTIVSIALIAIFVMVNVLLSTLFVQNAARGAKEGYKDGKQSAYDDVYNRYESLSHDTAEKLNHVKNRGFISVDGISKPANLEVLKVSDVVFVYTDASSTNQSWLQIPGTGMFIVDLTMGEYIVDNEHQHVLVRVPAPVFDAERISIDLSSVEILDSELKKGNVSDGVKLAQQQIADGERAIQEDIEANQMYFKYAREAAKTQISNLIVAMNPDIPDLSVDVDFYD